MKYDVKKLLRSVGIGRSTLEVAKMEAAQAKRERKAKAKELQAKRTLEGQNK